MTRDVSLHSKSRGVVQNNPSSLNPHTLTEDYTVRDNRYFNSTNSASSLHSAPQISNQVLNLHHTSPCPQLSLHNPTTSAAQDHISPCPDLILHQSNSPKNQSPQYTQLNQHHSTQPHIHTSLCPKLNLRSQSEHHSGPCSKLNLHHKGPCPKFNSGLEHQSPSEHHSGPCPRFSHPPGTSSHHSGPCSKSTLHQTTSERHTGPYPKSNLNHSASPSSQHSNMYPQSTVMNSSYQSTSTIFSPTTMDYGNQMNQKACGVTGGTHRETIHSGQFMVSDFEPESEVLDEEYEAGMPVPCVTEDTGYGLSSGGNASQNMRNVGQFGNVNAVQQKFNPSQAVPPVQSSAVVVHRPHLGGLTSFEGRAGFAFAQPQSTIIDGSLTKLFQCMSLAYRQKLTSPKWNPFKGVRLRWKDKIRLNNVIWRCWHMQFILKQRAMVCQFASPLDNDQHNKPEAVVMEGKYWKRKLSTVAAEYKKWRLFYRNRIMGWSHHHPVPDLHPISLDGFDWNRPGTFGGGPMSNLVFDDELLMDFSDTLFSSLSSQPFAFPNPRELSRAGMVADFIQPGLVQLQPNLDDFMDTFELHDYVTTKFLPSVPEQIEMDNLDLSEDLLMNADLPNLIQSRMQQSQYSKQSNVQNQQGSYGNISDNSAQNMFYPMTQTPEPNSRTSSTSLQNLALSKDTQKQGGEKTPSGYSSNYRDDMFAVPKGKPRGRSRSGNRNQSSSHSTVSMAPLATTNSQASSQSSSGQMSHIQMSPAMNSSQTLLSHLLTTPSHGHYATNTAGALEKNISANVSNQHVMPQQESSIPMPGSLIDIQQHQQQPWNPKNAKDTLSSNVSLNFGAKTYSQGSTHTNINGGSTEMGSPTRIPTSPSPPMGHSGSGPPTPPKLFRGKNDNERVFQEHRRVCHINAEQKRRCNIKNGFDMLHSLIPQLSHNPNAKVSKAAMLQKGAEYIRQLKVERGKLKQEIEAHRQEVEALNSAINNCQSMLPATGAPVSRQRTNKMKEMFDQWVRMRTLENWKFWLFSILIRPLLDSFNNAVSTSSLDELCRTVLTWIDQHCSLVDLRPAVLNSLRFLCTTTDILTNPSNLPEEATRAVSTSTRQDSNSEMSGSGSSDSR